jgi:hypothetical protein
MPRSVQNDTQEGVFDFLVGVEAALLADSDAADFAPRVAELLDGWESATKTLRAGQRKEAAARAVAGVRDAELDDEVLDFGDDLLRAVGKDRSDSRFRHYFKRPPATFVRVERMSEATTVKSWVGNVKTEPEPEVAAHAEPLGATAQASIDALDDVAKAAGDRAADRVRVWEAYTKKVDAACELLHADLVKRGQEKGRPKGWADRFFPVQSRARANGAAAAEEPAKPASPAAPPK